jgi:hypothetical protein
LLERLLFAIKYRPNRQFALKPVRPALLAASLIDRDTFVATVRSSLPKKSKLTAAQVGELDREYGATITPTRRIRAEVLASERRLSDLVNQAYGLSQAEDDLVWWTAPPRMPFTSQDFTVAVAASHPEGAH